MKDESISLQDQLNLANERNRQLEHQLHDKEREVKRMITELFEAHTSNRQLQVRIDELREEVAIHVPTTPSANPLLATEFEFPTNESNEKFNLTSTKLNHYNDLNKDSYQFVDIQKSILLNDMSPELTLRCYKSLLGSVANCHQHLFELKQEMWQIYQHIQQTNSMLRKHIHNQESIIENEAEDGCGDVEEEPQSPTPINLSSALSNHSMLVQRIVNKQNCSENSKEDVQRLKKKIENIERERDEAISNSNFLEMALSNAKVDLKSVNSQLLRAIQQKLSHQKELEAWQDDMEVMIQRGLGEHGGMRRVRSLRQPRGFSSDRPSNRLSLMMPYSSRDEEIAGCGISPTGHYPSSSSSTHSVSDNSTLPSADHNEKSYGFLTSWLRRKWKSSQTPPGNRANS